MPLPAKTTSPSKASTMIFLNMLLQDRQLMVGHNPNPALVAVRGICAHCLSSVTLGSVPIHGLIVWLSHGALIQDAFPSLSSDHREFLISRTCGPCWSRIFPPDLSES